MLSFLVSEGVVSAYWSFNLYPEAGEGGGCFVPTLRPKAVGGPCDPDRAQVEAARRARAKLRRYCAANRLDRLATLTYAEAGCHEHRELREDVAEFFRKLRGQLGGEAFPYAWTSEWHPGGHGLHVHFAVGQFVPQRLIRDVWGRGHVHIKRLARETDTGTLEGARVSGGYLAKYVSKNLGDERVPRLHRYEVAQGFQPKRVVLVSTSREGVLSLARERMGSDPSSRWESTDVEGWRGPPAYWRAWSD